MYIIGGFENSLYVELAIEELKEKGIKENEIVVVKMDTQEEPRNLFDSIHHSDGLSLFDGMAGFGGVGMTLGVIYGSQVTIGPIALGLLGLGVGACLGYILDRRIGKYKRSQQKEKYISLLLMIPCKGEQKDLISSIFQKHYVVTLGVLPKN